MAEVTDLVVQYDSAFGEVRLTAEDVKKYLVKGGGNLTDQELKLGMELCKYQKLNPFTGEVYFIKFGNDFQLVVGYETYKRRAEENPEYIGRKSGIVVQRGNDIVQKEGTCLYPTEVLIGGWCRVFRDRKGRQEETYKEVALSEYQKMKNGQPAANWATKPCTMIEKVAVSQALRAAFPTDYEGMYTEAEMGTRDFDHSVPDIPHNNQTGSKPEVIEGDYTEVDGENPDGAPEMDDMSKPITHAERERLFANATAAYGEEGTGVIRELCDTLGLTSTKNLTKQQYFSLVEALNERMTKDGIQDFVIDEMEW